MNKCLVAVIDGTRARFFTPKEAEFPEYETKSGLVEHKSLVNPMQKLEGKQLWATIKTGRNQGSRGQSHTYDDHRQNHIDEYERRFAQMIASEITNFTQVQNIQTLKLVAETQILGILRSETIPLLPKNIRIQELAKDLCKLKPKEIHEHLVNNNLI
ncbi:MAG: host attachment protein [Calothrix sp. C42_A2020_038]|nr:host attachment protein [Calothrix sp. C42_A2020_038]